MYRIRFLLCNSKSQQRAGPLWGLQDLVILAYHCFYENCFAGCSKNSSVGVSVPDQVFTAEQTCYMLFDPVSVSVLLVLMSWTRRAEKVVSSLGWLWGVASGNIHGHIYRSEKQETDTCHKACSFKDSCILEEVTTVRSGRRQTMKQAGGILTWSVVFVAMNCATRGQSLPNLQLHERSYV